MLGREKRMSDNAQSIAYDSFSCQFGSGLIASSEKGICYLGFTENGVKDTLEDLQSAWPDVPLVQADGRLGKVAESLFRFPQVTGASLDLDGTDFQIEVWKALLQIPVGSTVSYRWVAERVGRGSAIRAVASAIGHNKLAYLIPCHRVVRTNGELGGYRWGTERKATLLAWERASLPRQEATA